MKRILPFLAALSTTAAMSVFLAAGCMKTSVSEGDLEDQSLEDTEGEVRRACSYETCGHPKCSVGAALIHPACDPCVQQVCNEEGACCGIRWDQRCVDLAQALCAAPCNEGYHIRAKSTGQCLFTPSPERTSGVYQTPCADAADQRFFLSPARDGAYNVVAGPSGLCLTPDPFAHSDLEPQIVQFDCSQEGTNYVVYVGSGSYLLVDRFNGFCYEATSPGGGLRESECDGGSDQQFRFFVQR